ncbi:MAG: IMP dehydrogenase [Bacteroidia bacterium]|nr:IMP dehydrogenase [Bacteroidia bacterium]
MTHNSDKFLGEGLTFDDVLLVPAYSECLPNEVDITSQLTRNITLNVPIVSAAMDTVTESSMAIAIGQEGGIGIIHKNMSAEEQAEKVKKVKRSESVMIKDPITLQEDALLEKAVEIMTEKQIGGIPIVTEGNKLVGIITNRDLRFLKELDKPVKDVMTKDGLVTAKKGTTLKEAEGLLLQHKIEKLPILNGDQQLVGLITYKDLLKVRHHPLACKGELGRLRVGAAVGTVDTLVRVEALRNVDVDVVVVDTAHGHSSRVIDSIKEVKKAYPDLEIIAGNIATGEAAKLLVDAGVDAVKVGIGPGSICTTRVIAGVGVPQLSAIQEVAHTIKGSGVPVIADGGIRFSGDIVKAIAGGASSVMLGSLFAGVEESPGETIIYEGRKFKLYRGMGSIDAMKEGSKDRYFQDGVDDVEKLVPEGIVGRVPFKGSLSEVIYQMIGGLRAGMGYCGTANIKALQDKARFLKITAAGVRESHPHDITITREAPNYSR